MAIVSQEEMDRRIAAAGGRSLVHSGTVGKRKVPNPDYDKYDKNSTETLELDVQQWKSPEGHTIQAVQMPDGSWDVTQDEPPAPKPATATSPASAASGATTQIEGTPDPTKPGGFDNERPVEVTRDKNGNQVGLAVPLTGDKLQKWHEDRERSRNPGRKTDAELERERKTEAQQNRPTVTIREDGSGGLVSISTDPRTGQSTTSTIPGVKGKPDQVTVEGVTYERGADGTYKPAQGLPTPGAAAKNIDEFVPDYTQPDLGFGKWAATQRQKIGKPAEAGGITQKDYDGAVTAAHQQAQVTIQNVTSNQQVVRQQALDDQNQRKSLSEQAAGDYTRAQSTFNDLWKYTTPGSRAIMDVIPGVMAEQKRYRAEREGAATPMPPLHPMFTGMAQQAGVNIPRSDIGQQAANATANTDAQITRLTTPPAQPAAAPVAPVAPAAAPAPAFTPAPPVAAAQTPNPATPNLYPSAPEAPAPTVSLPNPPMPEDMGDGGRTPVPSVVTSTSPLAPGQEELPLPPTGTLPAGVVYPEAAPTPAPDPMDEEIVVQHFLGQKIPVTRREFESWPPFKKQQYTEVPRNAAPVQAGDTPVTMAPQQQGPVSSWANSLIQPQQQQPAPQSVNPALQTAQAGAAQPIFNPYETGGKLAAWGVPPDAVAVALKELGMVA